MLTSIILLPFLAALVILFTPRNYRVVFRSVALLATLGSLLIATKMFLGYEAARRQTDLMQSAPEFVAGMSIVGANGCRAPTCGRPDEDDAQAET